MDLWSRGGLYHGHYHTGYPWMWNMHCNQAGKAVKSPCGIEDNGWNINMRRLGRLTISHSHWLYHTPTNLPRQAPCACNGGNKSQIAGNITCAPWHWPEHYPGPWKASRTAMRYSRKNWVRQWGSFLKQPHRPFGPRTWHWVGISHSLSCTSLWKDGMM